jgi:hypothetical protein
VKQLLDIAPVGVILLGRENPEEKSRRFWRNKHGSDAPVTFKDLGYTLPGAFAQ